LISITFVQDQRQELTKRLDRYFKQQDSKMTRDRYLEMCEQLGKEPVESEIPPDWKDFPEVVISALNVFNMLGDRMYPEIGYVGKDYTNLSYFLDIYDIEDTEFFLELLTWLDSRAIRTSQEQLKREHDKLKRKNSG
jgi:hypothetical protein